MITNSSELKPGALPLDLIPAAPPVEVRTGPGSFESALQQAATKTPPPSNPSGSSPPPAAPTTTESRPADTRPTEHRSPENRTTESKPSSAPNATTQSNETRGEQPTPVPIQVPPPPGEAIPLPLRHLIEQEGRLALGSMDLPLDDSPLVDALPVEIDPTLDVDLPEEELGEDEAPANEFESGEKLPTLDISAVLEVVMTATVSLPTGDEGEPLASSGPAVLPDQSTLAAATTRLTLPERGSNAGRRNPAAPATTEPDQVSTAAATSLPAGNATQRANGSAVQGNDSADPSPATQATPTRPTTPRASSSIADGLQAVVTTTTPAPESADVSLNRPSIETTEAIEPTANGTDPNANRPPATTSPGGPKIPWPLGPKGVALSESQGVDQVDRVRFVQRVARAFQAANDEGGVVRLRLSPPELGSLRVEIRVEAGQLSARVEAESNLARSLLLDNLPALRERLEQQEIKITRFDVELFHDGAGTLSQGTGQDREALGSGQRVQGRRLASRESAVSSVESAGRPVRAGDGQFDVLI